ncbi:MAG: S41 family peptidase [Saprospiraceae bacterium]|nr:S41 family peptidase [Saprospiraceae bacterium]
MKRILKVSVLLAILVGGMATTYHAGGDKYFEILKNIEIFANLYKELNTNYVDEIDPGKLMRTGIDAMMGSLDPFTNYISESDIEGYRFMSEGKYHGIGALSEKIGDFVTITELYKDQPAEKAGLKVGDQLLAIDGKDVKNRNPDDINNILRGFPGTEVELTIRRPGKKDDFKVKLVREEVEVPNVPYQGLVSNDIGYISLTIFTRDAGANVAGALKELKTNNPGLKGIILDLRGNGGGLLTEAVNVVNAFVPKGELVVTTKGKVKDWDRSFKTMGAPVDEEIPLAVLINKNSASASEIVSGVFQDYDRGVLVGQRSYGKGLVQNTYDIGYNSKVKLTTAKYYIPSQRCIQSVEYKNGEPVDIPDEKRAQFKTRNGRTVLDGGGVKPDIYLDAETDIPVVKALLEQHFIFDYVTQFCLKNETIAAVEDFRFTNWSDFMQFLGQRNFEYDLESEKLLKQLKEKSGKEGFSLDAEIKTMEGKIKASKQNEIEKYKQVITNILEKEIAGRYYYQRGKTQMGLRNDQEISQAIEVLRDPVKYNKLLGNK